MQSAFSKGWDLAKKHYQQSPKSRAVPVIDPPRHLSLGEHERESFIDGYLAWCGGRYDKGAKHKPLR